MLYLDASALVKRYVREQGRRALELRLRADQLLYSSASSFAEVHAALARKHREREITQVEFLQARNQFERDWIEIHEVAVNAETLNPVPPLVERLRLRGMDAIHLAAAIWVERKFAQKPEVVSSDPALLHSAKGLGFLIFDPSQVTES